MYFAASQVPDNPCVDIAKQEFTIFGFGARLWDVIQDPFDLWAGEICGERQACLRSKSILFSILCQFIDDRIRTRILPDDGIVNWLARIFIPDNRCLALICNANRCNISGLKSAHLQRTLDDFLSPLPNFQWIMFYPARLGINLPMFLLVNSNDISSMIKDDKASTGGALINCRDVL